MPHLSLLTNIVNYREFNELSVEYKEPSSTQVGLSYPDILVVIAVINTMTGSNLRGRKKNSFQFPFPGK